MGSQDQEHGDEEGAEEKLNLPVVKETPPAKRLTMDQYLRFVLENLKNMPESERENRPLPANVRFKL